MQAVIDFARSGPLFSGDAATLRTSALVITDFNLAHRYATEQPAQYGAPWEDWTDLREHQAGAIRRHGPLPQEVEGLGLVSSRLRMAGFENASNEVREDLRNIVKSRLVESSASVVAAKAFWEELFRIYSLGLWPCGWMGAHPQGQLVVFSPKRLR